MPGHFGVSGHLVTPGWSVERGAREKGGGTCLHTDTAHVVMMSGEGAFGLQTSRINTTTWYPSTNMEKHEPLWKVVLCCGSFHAAVQPKDNEQSDSPTRI